MRKMTKEEREMMKTIKEIKELAMKIKEKSVSGIPPEWDFEL